MENPEIEEAKGGTILFVDDDQIDRMAFKRYAQKNEFPYDYIFATCVNEAEEIIQKEKFVAAVIDYQLGDGTAFDLFNSLADVPFIILTGLGDQEVAVRAMKAGAYDYLIKDREGHHFSTLPITIENSIKRKQAEEELERYRQHLESIVQVRTAELQKEIEERKHTEDALRESEAKYSSVVENSIDGILIVQDSYIKYSNPAAEHIAGYSFIEVNDTEFIHFVADEYKEMVAKKYAETMTGKKPGSSYEIEIIKKDHQRVFVELSTTRIDYKGNPAALVFLKDITDRKKTEEDLLKVKLGIEKLDEAVIITDTNGKITYVNPGFDKRYGFASEEIIGKSPQVLNLVAYEENLLSDYWKTLPNKDSVSGEALTKTKYNKTIIIEGTVTPILNGGGRIIGYLAIHRDISDRKKAEAELIKAKEQAESADRIKSEFLAQMSHEIRTPINTILSFSGLLRSELENKVEDDLRSCFAGVSAAGSRIIRTIDLILNVSEIQAGSYDYSPHEIDLNSDILEKIYAEKLLFAKDKGLELVLTNNAEDTKLNLDEYSITQIFDNLLDNAIKYTNSGKIEIICNSPADDKIEVEVVDTGIGIAEEYIPQLFEAFSQEDQGYTRRFEGNGLGLSLVKRYCDLNKAQISVKSEKGKGSHFSVIFDKKM